MFGHGHLMILSSLIGGLGLCGVFSSADMNSSTTTPSDSSFLIAPEAGSGYNTGSGATSLLVFLTGAVPPYLELLYPLAEWLG
jgi:hypothetical protein